MTEGVDIKEIEARIEELSKEFSRKLPQRFNEISQLFDNLLGSEKGREEVLVELHRQVHALVGTTGSFGYMKISNCFRELETCLKNPPGTFPELTDDAFIKSIRNNFALIDNAISEV